MRTPEEVWDEIEDVFDSVTQWRISDGQRALAAALIRARDAEVRAEALAGFTEERGFRDDRGRDHALSPGHESEDVPQVFTRTRRLVGPWQPDDEP